MQINKIQSNINFTSTSRRYTNSYGDEIGCNSWLFRDDIDWKSLAKYENSHFADKDKVNVVMFAASDGSEAYTKIMSLYENAGKENQDKLRKYFPIMAYDVDREILKAARSGLIKTSMMDRIGLQINTDNYEDYFEKAEKDLKIVDDSVMQSEKTLKAKDILTKNVKFDYGDMFKKVVDIKDNSNTILMCRNILGYFFDHDIERFIKLASNVLKSGSLFAIGEHDHVLYDIKNMMEKSGFKEVLKNVYRKI